jgi:hypothetical protein
MKRLGGFFLIFSFIALVGCGSKTAAGPEAPVSKEGAPANDGAATSTEPKMEVPSKLRHEGFAYYGLSKAGELKYDFSSTPAPATAPTAPGVVSTALTEANENEATFGLTRAGFGELDSSDTVLVNDKGVFLTASSKGKFGEPTMELPADVKPGSAWNIRTTFDAGTGKIDLVSNLKAVKIENVTTKGGSFDALRVELTGTLKAPGNQAGKLTGTSWYVKDLGMVKQEMTQSIGANSATVKMELAEKPAS